MVNLIRSNCNLELRTYPTYVLRYVNKGMKSCIGKVFSCGDDNVIFPNDHPCVLLLKDNHYLNVWDYSSLLDEIDCPDISRKKCNKGSGERYKKHFCLRCIVSFSSERLHICQGVCEKCLEKVENHLDSNFSDNDIQCEDCERCFHLNFVLSLIRLKSYMASFKVIVIF